jgi:phage-related baseplate assembly protein
MSLTPEQILAIETETDVVALDAVILDLTELGFAATAWQPGAKARTLIQAFAKHVAGSSRVAPKLLRSVLLGLSKGDSLDLLAMYVYGGKLDAQFLRRQARAAERTVRFAVAASASDISIAPGSVVATPEGQQFTTTNASPVAVSAGGTSAPITIRARVPGRAANVGTVSRLVTAYAGTTLTSDTITLPGTDRESDALLTRRLELRWSEQTYAVGPRAYELWAYGADQAITRVWVAPPGDIANRFRIYLATEDGPATPTQVAAVQAAYTVDRRAVNDDPIAAEATTTTQTIQAAITVDRRYAAKTTEATLAAALATWIGSLPIGGERIPTSAASGKLYRDSIRRKLFAQPGVLLVDLALPATDITLAPSRIITPTFDLSVTYADAPPEDA